ncbi:MAG: hypothetical protein QXT28_03435 [Thermofilaceae archaeon]
MRGTHERATATPRPKAGTPRAALSAVLLGSIERARAALSSARAAAAERSTGVEASELSVRSEQPLKDSGSRSLKGAEAAEAEGAPIPGAPGSPARRRAPQYRWKR